MTSRKAPSADLKASLVAAIPNMRAFAISLCGDVDRADDLVQEALVKAWNGINSFAEGSNLKAWLFTILRNAYFSELRKRKREVSDSDGELTAQLSVPPEQQGHVDLADLRTALSTLPSDQREALVLVGAEGFSLRGSRRNHWLRAWNDQEPCQPWTGASFRSHGLRDGGSSIIEPCTGTRRG